MRILSNKSKTVFVMSNSGANCPRAVITSKKMALRDDYKGNLKFGKTIAKKIGLA
jgi:hypothetical protein